MDNIVPAYEMIDRLLPEHLHRLQRLGGLPVVFGGATRTVAGQRSLVISRIAGTRGTGLRRLAVRPGLGLGGAVLRMGVPKRVDDYGSTGSISHEYDRIVVHEEGLTSVFAVPVIVGGAVEGVVYGAVREVQPIGDRALAVATTIVRGLEQDVEARLRRSPTHQPAMESTTRALAELAAVVAATEDENLRATLGRIHRDLGGTSTPPATGPRLAPRERDALELVEVGASNAEIADELGLRPETVKAYLRSAMRKLGVHNRTAAVHAARAAGAL